MTLSERVTVLVAVHNEARFLAEALDSVLSQSYPDFRLLVVDDGSTDGSRQIIERYTDPRVRLIVNPTPRGLAASLNRGLGAVDTEYVARFDGNDRCLPGRLAAQVAWLDQHPDVAVLGTQQTLIDAEGRPTRSTGTRRPTTIVGIHWWHLFDNPIVHGAAMCRTAIIRDQLGGYDESFLVGEDADLWRRVAARHRIANLPEPLVAMRIDPGSTFARLRVEHRVAYAEKMKSVTHARLQEALDWPEVPAEWTEAWIAVKHELEPPTPRAAMVLIEAIDAWAARFVERFPEAAGDSDVRHHRATMLARLVTVSASRAPLLAASTWRKIVPLDGQVARETLPLLLALGLGGRRLIALRRRLRERSTR